MEKTNVMRILDQKKIKYTPHYYDNTITNGMEVANTLNLDPNKVFKTLVTIGASKRNYVFVVPVNSELDLKKAAQIVNEKSIEMIKSKELLDLTGYIHGGCSPIGMKKPFRTVMNKSALDYEEVTFSAGRIGFQVEMNPLELKKLINISYDEII
jgi:Cys-tRNA(Pro)/Cys-tRNA(Cys) deacylase